MSNKPIILINVLKVEPAKQDALIASLRQNIETVIRSLDGWKTTRLIASNDRTSVVIYSEWETPDAVAAMQLDPRMMAYFPRVSELAKFDSMSGTMVLSESR